MGEITYSGHFRVNCTGTIELVPVQFRFGSGHFWPTCTGTC